MHAYVKYSKPQTGFSCLQFISLVYNSVTYVFVGVRFMVNKNLLNHMTHQKIAAFPRKYSIFKNSIQNCVQLVSFAVSCQLIVQWEVPHFDITLWPIYCKIQTDQIRCYVRETAIRFSSIIRSFIENNLSDVRKLIIAEPYQEVCIINNSAMLIWCDVMSFGYIYLQKIIIKSSSNLLDDSSTYYGYSMCFLAQVVLKYVFGIS